MGKNNNSET